MAAHKHAAMIKAKADNMKLAVFIKIGNGPWLETSGFPTDENYLYFLCLPQHKEACHHWLNGGEIQFKNDGLMYFEDIDYGYTGNWSLSRFFMDEQCQLRIKPRKQKRYIAIRKSDLFIEDCLFHSVENAIRQGYPESQWQLHEIEVEV